MTWIGDSAEFCYPRMSELEGPRGFQSGFYFFNFLIHGGLSSSTVLLGSPTFERDINKVILTETEVGVQSHSFLLPHPQDPLRPLGGAHRAPWCSAPVLPSHKGAHLTTA